MVRKNFIIFIVSLLVILGFANLRAFAQIRIAYQSNESGNLDVYVLTLDESLNVVEKIRLTDWPSDEIRPRWSHDGSMITFTSNYQGGQEAWIMNADGSNKKRITYSSLNAASEVWGLDVNYIYGLNSSAGDGEVAEFDVSTNDIKMLTDIPGYNTQSFDLNSNQTKIAFVRGIEGNGYTNELYIADFESDGTDFFNIVYLPAAFPAPHSPKFSPDDKHIVFFTTISNPRQHGISIINIDGTGFWSPIPLEGRVNRDPVWIDCNRIVYSCGPRGSENLYVLDIRDLSKVQLTNSPYGDNDAAVFYMHKQVDIDIKPRSDPNSINLGSNGNVPVAIFSTADFDATTVDPTTVTLAGAEVKVKGKGTAMSSTEDVNGNGLLDLIVHVDTTALELCSADTEAILEGQTYEEYGGIRIRGIDTVRIVQE
jgi:hypothetical protein